MTPEFNEFRALSARLGQDPLQVQGPGGNTSIKMGTILWIKASGTELAQAEIENIFVPVDLQAARAEARGEKGDGSCKNTVTDPAIALRPSIETTFHAALEHQVVAHTHSVATLVHAISPEGRQAAQDKLQGLPFAMVPYAKPGLPLTRCILDAGPAQIFVLHNHGLICCGASVAEVSALIAEVESRLAMPAQMQSKHWLATDPRACELALAGSYYPDHVVFLGPALPTRPVDTSPAVLEPGVAVSLRADATSSQRAMLRCLSDVLARLPSDWSAEAIGAEAEAELLNWDAEKYRQALAAGLATGMETGMATGI